MESHISTNGKHDIMNNLRVLIIYDKWYIKVIISLYDYCFRRFLHACLQINLSLMYMKRKCIKYSFQNSDILILHDRRLQWWYSPTFHYLQFVSRFSVNSHNYRQVNYLFIKTKRRLNYSIYLFCVECTKNIL